MLRALLAPQWRRNTNKVCLQAGPCWGQES